MPKKVPIKKGDQQKDINRKIICHICKTKMQNFQDSYQQKKSYRSRYTGSDPKFGYERSNGELS